MEDQNITGLRAGVEISHIFTSLIMGILLPSAGFLAGWYWQVSNTQDLVKVEVVQNTSAGTFAKGDEPAAVLEKASSSAKEACQFVGSKNSDKYHSPGSAPAKRIKESNTVCFASAEEAEARGYTAGTLK